MVDQGAIQGKTSTDEEVEDFREKLEEKYEEEFQNITQLKELALKKVMETINKIDYSFTQLNDMINRNSIKGDKKVKRAVSESQCIAALKKAFTYFERNFTRTEYNTWRNYREGTPSSEKIISTFNTWNEAKKHAGIDLPMEKKKKASIELFIDGEKAKKCRKCGELKVLAEFHRTKNGAMGRSAHCKGCVNEHKRNYHHENKERMNLKSEIYYKENREKVLERQKRNRTYKEMTTR